MKELEFKPWAAFRLDGASPFADYSGFSRTATRSGTEVKGVPLTSTALYSQQVNTGRELTFTVPDIFEAGTEKRGSSIALTVYSGGSSSMAHGTDTFVFAKGSITCTFNFANSTTAVLSHIFNNQKASVVITATDSRLNLFVNGVLVDEYTVTLAQQAAGLVATSDNFVTTTTSNALYNNVCFFTRALSQDEIKAIYNYNTRRSDDVPVAYAGEIIRLSTDVRKPSMEVVWDTDAEWRAGQHEQTVVDGNQLQAQRQDGLTLDGKWSNSITFAAPVPLSTFQSAYVTWEGKNVAIELSLDGTTWITPVYGKNLSIIPTGFDPNDRLLHMRVNFVAGLTEAYLSEFRFRAFTGPTAPTHIDERVITYANPAQAWNEYTPDLMRDFWGVDLSGTGRVTIGSEADFLPKTVELWIRPTTGGTVTYSTNLATPTSTYVNGVLSATQQTDQWTIVHRTYAAGVTGDIWVQGDVTVGRVAVYPNVLTQAEITSIVQAYTGLPRVTHPADAIIQLAEATSPAAFFNHNWANLYAPT